MGKHTGTQTLEVFALNLEMLGNFVPRLFWKFPLLVNLMFAYPKPTDNFLICLTRNRQWPFPDSFCMPQWLSVQNARALIWGDLIQDHFGMRVFSLQRMQRSSLKGCLLFSYKVACGQGPVPVKVVNSKLCHDQTDAEQSHLALLLRFWPSSWWTTKENKGG